MRLFWFMYCVLMLSAAFAVEEEPHAYLKNGYNETVRDPERAVTKFLEIAFPDIYDRDILPFYGHYDLMAGSSKAKIIVLPDLKNGISTRASTVQYIQGTLKPWDAILFVHDPINQQAAQTVLPQAFACKKALYRSPGYINQDEFEKKFWNNYLHVHRRFKKWESCQCYRLALDKPSPLAIKNYIDTIASHESPPRRYYVILDQNQMPGQVDANYKKEDWDAAFGKTGYLMLIDLYAKTSRE